MSKNLVIIESPGKIATLKKILGADYIVETSIGHIRDLPKKGFGIDLEALSKGECDPEYIIIPDKTKVVATIKEKAKKADVIYLASDPDREGEAIAWHIAEILLKDEKLKKGEKSKLKIKRITFNALTKSAVEEALLNPTEINQPRVDAQQARRLLDRIVGYKLSPIVNNKVIRRTKGTNSISAGRVQSVALKLVVDREKEIEAFDPQEYWNLNPILETVKEKTPFQTLLYLVDGKRAVKPQDSDKPNSIVISNEKLASEIEQKLKKAKFKTGAIEKSQKNSFPVAPFITSTLQQEAWRYYKFDSKRTMRIAQSLYEGINLGDGPEGLITYMRTDSVRISPEGLDSARKYITETFPPEYLPEKARFFKQKKASQDAHEAIRPVYINKQRSPEAMAKHLDDEQQKLYALIWRRFIASQMSPAVYDQIAALIETDENGLQLRATGSTLKFPGFLAIYQEKNDLSDDEEKEKMLPFLEEGQPLKLRSLTPEQSFTRPPPRFTEASLIKELEASGIGRPSTYTAIMTKIQGREFTTKEKGTLKPTPLGMATADFLTVNFPMIMNRDFTVDMEEALDGIEEEKVEWKPLMKEFYKSFEPELDKAVDAQVPKVSTKTLCPKCGKAKLEKTWSKDKRKYFLGCSSYPECDYTIDEGVQQLDKDDYDPNFNWEQSCPLCGGEMLLRVGKFGPFLTCSKYPECKKTVNIPKAGEQPIDAGTTPCPAIGCVGTITAKRSMRGIFYGCSNYPNCDVAGPDLEIIKTKYVDHPVAAYIKAERKGKMILYKLSPALQDVVSEKKATRPELTSKIWKYIREHNLQNPKNKREIILDEKLSLVFSTNETPRKAGSTITMFEIAKLISHNLGR